MSCSGIARKPLTSIGIGVASGASSAREVSIGHTVDAFCDGGGVQAEVAFGQHRPLLSDGAATGA